MGNSAVRGFTILELIVTVTLIMLVTGIFIAAYNTFNSQQAVIQGAYTLKNNLVRIRTHALSGDKPVGEQCDSLIGYEVTFPQDETDPSNPTLIKYSTYTSQAICQVNGERQPVGAKIVYSLPKTVEFDPVPTTMQFDVLNGHTNSRQTLTLKGINKSTQVQITEAGLISDYEQPTPTP